MATANDHSPNCVGGIRASARGWLRLDKPEDTEGDDKETGADLDLALPFDKGDEQRERKDHQQHRQQMAGRQRPKR